MAKFFRGILAACRFLAALGTAGAVNPSPNLPPWVRTLIAVAVACAVAALEVLKHVPTSQPVP